MQRQISDNAAVNSISELLSQAAAGETIEIVRDGKVIARLQPPAPRPDSQSRTSIYCRTRGGL